MRRIVSLILILAAIGFACRGAVHAGMPALLPTQWTQESEAVSEFTAMTSRTVALRLQAISFFTVTVLLTAGAVMWLWNGVRSDFPGLPVISYPRALSLVMLWGMVFVVVLTMISGARELMTPGAWRKQGWTYVLANESHKTPADTRSARKKQLESLRFALWQYAATHNGQFPGPDSN